MLSCHLIELICNIKSNNFDCVQKSSTPIFTELDFSYDVLKYIIAKIKKHTWHVVSNIAKAMLQPILIWPKNDKNLYQKGFHVPRNGVESSPALLRTRF